MGRNQIYINYDWRIGLIKSDNSELSIIKANYGLNLYEPIWTSDGKYIVAYNMETIFKYDLNGNVIDSIDITRTFGKNYSMTGFTRFIFTSDNRFIIYNCGGDEFWENLLGPVEAIFIYDIRSKEISRLSPKGMYASDLNIVDDTTVIFSGSEENGKGTHIYSVDVASKKLKLIMKDAMRPTMSKRSIH